MFQVHSPLNLKHPHDVVIFMRQDARVNYLKKLEVCGFHFDSSLCKYVFCHCMFIFGFQPFRLILICAEKIHQYLCSLGGRAPWHYFIHCLELLVMNSSPFLVFTSPHCLSLSLLSRSSLWHRRFILRRMRTETQGWSRDTTKRTQTVSWLRYHWETWTCMMALISLWKAKTSGKPSSIKHAPSQCCCYRHSVF